MGREDLHTIAVHPEGTTLEIDDAARYGAALRGAGNRGRPPRRRGGFL